MIALYNMLIREPRECVNFIKNICTKLKSVIIEVQAMSFISHEHLPCGPHSTTTKTETICKILLAMMLSGNKTYLTVQHDQEGNRNEST